MRIAISAKGSDLESRVDLMFGRCRYVLLVDPETQAFEVLSNECASGYENSVVKAKALVAAGAEALVSGNLSRDAAKVLQKGGVKVYPSISGMVQQILERFRHGGLEDIPDIVAYTRFDPSMS